VRTADGTGSSSGCSGAAVRAAPRLRGGTGKCALGTSGVWPPADNIAVMKNTASSSTSPSDVRFSRILKILRDRRRPAPMRKTTQRQAERQTTTFKPRAVDEKLVNRLGKRD
jgi:hypothetical protein